MNKKLLISLGLCGRGFMFMAPDACGSTGNGDTGTDTTGTEGTDEQTGTKSFDDVLKDKAYQSEFDKRISKALETAKSKW